jgi:sugar lactone lactonase YvrE
MTVSAPRIIAEGFVFTEGPRWHDGALWFSDIHGHRVHRLVPPGPVEVIAEVIGDDPSGLGWLPDSRLLIVAMEHGRLLRLEGDGTLAEHADLSPLARGSVNDMIVRGDGTAYVGDMGARIFEEGAERLPGQTIRVAPDGSVSCAADDLASPNGHILTDDDGTLIVAESGAGRLTAFDVEADGALTNRRTFAELTPEKEGVVFAPPDGICLDAEGAVWVADPLGARVFRVLEGGEVTDTVRFEGVIPVACVLGGRDRRTLFMCVAVDWRREALAKVGRTGRIDAVDVDVPGAGRP